MRPKPLSQRERGRGEGFRTLRVWRPQFRVNASKHGVEIVADLGVREPDNANAHPFEDFSSTRVVVCKPLVLLSVELDYELRRVAIEVDDIAVEWDLTAELGAMKAGAAERFPEKLLCRGWIPALGACELTSV